ncbi:hypothetical protein NLU13_7476 [Sarocladium strictum]|uniref:Uncharacterized protein n=1 Tax=Sarocladium strictum TaxID=5046 RepID=A0AA39GCV6_SARSR|nr:hypothetical protein NLU13_7476 [Sarocladium strictum]
MGVLLALDVHPSSLLDFIHHPTAISHPSKPMLLNDTVVDQFPLDIWRFAAIEPLRMHARVASQDSYSPEGNLGTARDPENLAAHDPAAPGPLKARLKILLAASPW